MSIFDDDDGWDWMLFIGCIALGSTALIAAYLWLT